MRNLTLTGLAFLGITLVAPSPASAQDSNAMLKWAEAKVIHYHAVGDYTGDLSLYGGFNKAKLTDHLELDFDWNNEELKVIGQPAIKNFPTTLVSVSAFKGCPAPKVSGNIEYLTLQSIDAQSMMLTLKGKRDIPAASVPSMKNYEQGKCGDSWDSVAAQTENVEAQLQVPQAMLLAMPTALDGMKVSKDGKSIIVTANTDGWVWTMTPTIVK